MTDQFRDCREVDKSEKIKIIREKENTFHLMREFDFQTNQQTRNLN